MATARIFLCGYYGFGNTGDEVILQGIAAALRAELGEVELQVTSGGGPLEVPATAVPWQDVARIREAVRLADLVVVGGGGLFQDYWGVDRATLGTPAHHGVTFYSWPLLLAAERGVPALVWGVGVGPLVSEEGRALVQEAMAAATWVSVRDRGSAQLLGELGFEGRVELVPDPAWATPRREVDRAAVLAEMGLPPAATLVAVAPRRWPEDRVPAEEVLVQALRQVARRRPLGVVLVPFQRGAGRDDDEAAAADLATTLAGQVPCWMVPAAWSAASRFWLCATADVTVGVRLHACLAAARGGRRPVGVAYDPKVSALFEELGDPGGAREPTAWTPEGLAGAITERLERPELGLARAPWEEASRRPAAVARRLLAEPTEQARTKKLPRDGGKATMELSRRALQCRLEGILASHRAPREMVLFLPSVYWQTEVFQRPNQLALALARAGCLVFFWEPPTTQRFAPGFHRVGRRLYVANVPGEVWAALHDPVVVALPYNGGFADTLGSFRLVYDVIDHLDVFPGGRAALEGEHRRLLAEAQVVVAVSRPLLEEVRAVRPDAVYLPNAADPEGIRRAVAAAGGRRPFPPGGGELRLGYFGSLAGWLDYDLLAALLAALPEARLELIGPDLDGSFAESGLGDHPRVQHLGARPYGEVHAAFSAVHAGLIPFRMNEITAAVSPLKLYEYLAMGVPVVSTELPECRGVPGVWVARSAEEMAGVLRQLVAGQLSLDEDARARFVAANTWGHRAEALLEAVAAAPLRPLPRAHGVQLARRLAEAEAAREEEEQRRAGAEESLRQAQGSLAELQRRHGELVEAFGQRQREVERLTSLWQEEVRCSGRLEAEAAAAGRETDAARAEAEAARAEAAQTAARLDELVRRFEERQREVERLADTLTRLTSTRWFRLASRYWRLRARLRGDGAPSAPPRTAAAAAAPAPAGSPPGAAPAGPSEATAAGELLPPGPDGHWDYLFFPIIDWEFRFQRPQQLATALAAKGHRVFYCRIGFRRRGSAVELTPKGDNLWEVSLRGPDRNVYRDAPDRQEVEELCASLEELRRQVGLAAPALVVELPFWWPVARELGRRWGVPVVYDCMDYHPGFSTNDAAMLSLEEELIAGADLVVVSSAWLEERVAPRARRLLRIPNGCDWEHFARLPWRPPAHPLTVGYYGAIADWFDAPLVGELARLRPDWQFLLVGSTYTCDTAPLAGLPNLRLVGEQPYAELPRWVERMDVLIIPFRRTPLTEATNPVKFYEIMAAGKPLVAVSLPELRPHPDLVAFAETAAEFAARIEEVAAGESEERSLVRRAFAREQTWQRRVEALAPAVAESFPLASVVVVTYDNLPLTRACLESVLTRTAWPRFEVIVVDNGSSDGTPAYLEGLAAADPRVQIILNGDNRGFAAANNQGLARARGEYLVLLNNDTVVVRGWLDGLIRHLAAHPEWGLVGPVTNWIGNEAQIPVGYTSLEEMPAWAARHCRQHDGQSFPIPVLAMFCVAMRRRVWERVGTLDERFGMGMFEDDDYAERVRQAGLAVMCVEDVFVHHEGKAAFKRMDEEAYRRLFETNRRAFEEKWGRPWQPHRYRGQ